MENYEILSRIDDERISSGSTSQLAANGELVHKGTARYAAGGGRNHKR